MAAPNWKPCVHSVQPRLVYAPPTVNTGVPSAGFQRFSRRSIFSADSSNRRRRAGSSPRAVREGSMLSTSQPFEMKTTVDVQDRAGGEREGALEQRDDCAPDVV